MMHIGTRNARFDLSKMPRARALECGDVAVLVLAETEGAITRAEVEEHIGCRKNVAIIRLGRLIDRELLMAVGGSKNRIYGLTPKGRRVVMAGRVEAA